MTKRKTKNNSFFSVWSILHKFRKNTMAAKRDKDSGSVYKKRDQLLKHRMMKWEETLQDDEGNSD